MTRAIDIVAPIAEKYSLQLVEAEEGCALILANDEDKFWIEDNGGECFVESSEWEEVCYSYDILAQLIFGLLTGDLHIVVKYGGDMYCSHQLRGVEWGKTVVLGSSADLIVPALRKKSYEVIRYKGGVKTVEDVGEEYPE